MQVSNCVSQVSAISQVREMLVPQQQLMGKKKAVVMDGRDIGSVVFPNAELKLFMTASEDIRAQRRYHELIAKGSEVSIEEVKANLSKRDYIDSHRDTAPLIQTNDAIVLDNSHLSQKEQLDWVLEKQNKLVLVWDNYFMALDEPIFIEIFSNISTVFIRLSDLLAA